MLAAPGIKINPEIIPLLHLYTFPTRQALHIRGVASAFFFSLVAVLREIGNAAPALAKRLRREKIKRHLEVIQSVVETGGYCGIIFSDNLEFLGRRVK